MQRLALSLSLALLSCGGAPSTPPPRQAPSQHVTSPPQTEPSSLTPPRGVSRVPTPSEDALIGSLARETERLRQLPFRAPVAVRIQDRTAMRAYVEGALDEQELMRARRRYVALGLLDEALDVRALIAELMEEELIGYYDPEQKLLAVREDIAHALADATNAQAELEWRATMVHELVHALQDQHLNLSGAMHETRTTDQENVFGAIVEGDATLAMLGYVAVRQGGSLAALTADTRVLTQRLRQTPLATGSLLAAAPAIVREPLLFRYREGAVFAAALYARGGWEAVNEAHRHLPSSTLEVSDPSRKLRVKPAVAGRPDLTEAVAKECQPVDTDVLGSLEIGAALGSTELTSSEVQRGWRDDFYTVFDCAGRDASLWFLRFGKVSLARRVHAALVRLDPQGLRRIAQHADLLMVARGFSEPLASLLTAEFRSFMRAPGQHRGRVDASR